MHKVIRNKPLIFLIYFIMQEKPALGGRDYGQWEQSMLEMLLIVLQLSSDRAYPRVCWKIPGKTVSSWNAAGFVLSRAVSIKCQPALFKCRDYIFGGYLSAVVELSVSQTVFIRWVTLLWCSQKQFPASQIEHWLQSSALPHTYP